MEENGMTWRQNLEARAAQGGDGALVARAKLDGPEMPVTLGYLWMWWGELSAARGIGANGLDPISYQDIDAWARLMDRQPEHYEVQALIRLDAAMRNPGDD